MFGFYDYYIYEDVTIGTLTDNFTTTVTTTLSPKMINMANAQGITLSQNNLDIDLNNIKLDDAFFIKCFGQENYGNSSNYNKIKTAITNTCIGGGLESNVFVVTVKTVGTYSEATNTYYLGLTGQSLRVRTQSLSVDNSAIVF